MPLSTNDDVLEFRRMDRKSEDGFTLVRESTAPGGKLMHSANAYLQ